MKEKLVGKGAEAEVRQTTWNGKPALRKVRIEKKYRVPSLDYSLRKRRTRREAKCLRIARQAGVPVPELFFENEEKFELIVERLHGTLLSRKEVSPQEALQAGEVLAGLHAAGIIHGDFSTSNLMAVKAGGKAHEIVAIDFGLSELSNNVEQRADDAIVFEKSLDNPALAKSFRQGYSQKMGKKEAQLVFARGMQILSRARYARSAL